MKSDTTSAAVREAMERLASGTSGPWAGIGTMFSDIRTLLAYIRELEQAKPAPHSWDCPCEKCMDAEGGKPAPLPGEPIKRFGFTGWTCRDGETEPDFGEHGNGPYVLYSDHDAAVRALAAEVEHEKSKARQYAGALGIVKGRELDLRAEVERLKRDIGDVLQAECKELKELRAANAALAEELARVKGMSNTFPLHDVLTRLADSAEHLHGHHNCDCLGYEIVMQCIAASRGYAEAALRGRDGEGA